MVVKFVASLFAFFTLSYASTVARTINEISFDGATPSPSPAGKKIASIIPLSRQEITDLAVESANTGIGRVTRFGLSVTKGASAELRFDVRVNAVDAETIDRADERILETLSASERTEFMELKENFDRSLNLPILQILGLDLREGITAEQIAEAAASVENFEMKASAVTEILESVSDTRIRINGTLTATGLSNVPTVAFAFIELSEVQFTDGSSQLVVSNRDDSAIAATRNGSPVDTSDQNIDVICTSGFFC